MADVFISYARPDRERIAAQTEARAALIEAETDADLSRAEHREDERDNFQQRAMVGLPYALAVAGIIVLTGLGGLVFWDLRRARMRAPAPTQTPALPAPQVTVYLLPGWESRREMWSGLAQAMRGELPGGDRRVIVLDEDGREV